VTAFELGSLPYGECRTGTRAGFFPAMFGQLFFGREHTRGGWDRGDSTLKALLVKAGLSAQALAVKSRASRTTFPARAVAIGGGIAVVLAAIGASSIAKWRPSRSTFDTKEPPE
jgi:hypothetical protein